MPRSRAMNQRMVEHLTGMSREVLRKWEQRYGFPVPARGARGQRIYSHADMDKLLIIRRLLRAGMRPARLVNLSREELLALVDAAKLERGTDENDIHHRIELLTAALKDPAQLEMVHALLGRWLYLDGPFEFACHTLAHLNDAVGSGWKTGALSIHQEHWYAERMRRTLIAARAECVVDRRWPRIVLSTPPGETHELALLGLELALATRGIDVAYLGPQTPVNELCAAAHGYQAGVVALSVSPNYPADLALAYVAEARAGLPTDCELWVGGKGVVDLQPWPADVVRFQSIEAAVLHWQSTHPGWDSVGHRA